jgi:hypothetical protein
MFSNLAKINPLQAFLSNLISLLKLSKLEGKLGSG